MTDTITTADTTTAGVAGLPSIADALAIAERIQALTAGNGHPGSADIAPEPNRLLLCCRARGHRHLLAMTNES